MNANTDGVGFHLSTIHQSRPAANRVRVNIHGESRLAEEVRLLRPEDLPTGDDTGPVADDGYGLYL